MITASHVGIGVRYARPADAPALVEVFRESWRHAYGGIIPALHLARMISRRDLAWWRASIQSEPHFLVLEVGGRIAGYATCGAVRSARRPGGEIYELYLTPVHQGLGLGQHLFEACRQRLDADAFQGLIVWALADNEAAKDFYRRCGGRPVAKSCEKYSGKKLEKIAFGWD
ncbi:MAG: N-acetyltransferase family protein [Hyphomicrobium sp.]